MAAPEVMGDESAVPGFLWSSFRRCSCRKRSALTRVNNTQQLRSALKNMLATCTTPPIKRDVKPSQISSNSFIAMMCLSTVI